MHKRKQTGIKDLRNHGSVTQIMTSFNSVFTFIMHTLQSARGLSLRLRLHIIHLHSQILSLLRLAVCVHMPDAVPVNQQTASQH